MSLHLLLRLSIGRHVGRNEVKLLNEQCRQPPLHHTRPGCPRGPHRRRIERNRAWWPVVPTFTRPRAASRAPGTPNRLGPPPTGWGAEPPTPPTPPTRSGLPPPTCSGLNPNLLGVPPNGLGATVTGDCVLHARLTPRSPCAGRKSLAEDWLRPTRRRGYSTAVQALAALRRGGGRGGGRVGERGGGRCCGRRV